MLRTQEQAAPRRNAALQALDLESIEQRLSQKGWDSTRIQEAVLGYRAFLQRVASGELPRPSHDVDEVWHCHILQTKRYAADCEQIFGRFLHHNPESGLAELCTPALALCVPSITGNSTKTH